MCLVLSKKKRTFLNKASAICARDIVLSLRWSVPGRASIPGKVKFENSRVKFLLFVFEILFHSNHHHQQWIQLINLLKTLFLQHTLKDTSKVLKRHFAWCLSRNTQRGLWLSKRGTFTRTMHALNPKSYILCRTHTTVNWWYVSTVCHAEGPRSTIVFASASKLLLRILRYLFHRKTPLTFLSHGEKCAWLMRMSWYSLPWTKIFQVYAFADPPPPTCSPLCDCRKMRRVILGLCLRRM